MFSKIMVLLERAKTREVAPPPEATTGTETPTAASVARLQPSEIPPGHPNPFTQILPTDDEDSYDADDAADETMAGEGAAVRELAKAEKLLESFITSEGGSCG